MFHGSALRRALEVFSYGPASVVVRGCKRRRTGLQASKRPRLHRSKAGPGWMSQHPPMLCGVRPHLVLGRAGEDAAARHLEALGFEVVDRNWRCALGELDIVAARGDLLVFCEVKARRSTAWGEPSEAVDGRKRARLRRLAGRWLAEHQRRAQVVRFDVVSIVQADRRTDVRHIPDAF